MNWGGQPAGLFGASAGGVFGAQAGGGFDAPVASSSPFAASTAHTAASASGGFAGASNSATFPTIPNPLAQENDRLRARIADLESELEAMRRAVPPRESRRSQPREVADLLGLKTDETNPSAQESARRRARDTELRTNFDNLEAMIKELELRQGRNGMTPALPFRYSDETSPSDYEEVLERLGHEPVLVVFYDHETRMRQAEQISRVIEEVKKVQPSIRVVKVVAVVTESHMMRSLSRMFGAPAGFSYCNCSEGYPTDWDGPRCLTFRYIKSGEKVDYTPDHWYFPGAVIHPADATQAQEIARWNAFKRLLESP